MTENADVEWLRAELDDRSLYLDSSEACLVLGPLRRLLAHIDELEAEVKMLREVEAECGRQLDRRPTVHEIAAQMMAALVGRESERDAKLAEWAYGAAEALEAEGRRRDAAVHD